ncbi:MAG: carboxypeptidase regulatory-like domain-containing protein [Bryobacterales bacterium]|nr:carboxypeptidase regulatory-like domain-containing protein [Bryobacterales bacterium]
MKVAFGGLKLAILALFAIGVALAQQSTGTISGVVTDQQGAVIPGAQVSVLHTSTNTEFSTSSNESGLYVAPGMAVGEYEVTVEADGFRRSVRSGITLQVGQNAAVDVTLEIGQVTEVVEVIGQAPLVDTGGATIGEVIERKRVSDLPLNGRGALALAMLTAGVVSNAGPTNSGFGDRGIQLSSVSINGSPNSMNAQMLDGNNNILSYVGEVGVPIAVDAVEEFKVQSGTMSSEFGFTAGGAINLVSRSGTNEIHGSVYEFLRNDAMDARNTFARRRLPLRYNQYGAAVGGPVIKNRTFGFFNWEEYRLRRSSPSILNVPVPEFLQGDFSQLRTARGDSIPLFDPDTTRPNPTGGGLVRDPYPNNQVPSASFDPASRNVLPWYPAPNRTPSNPYTFSQNFQWARRRSVNWSQWNLKIDHRFSEKNSMFARYTTARHQPFSNNPFTDPNVGRSREDDQTNRNFVISDTHTFSPTLINNLRVGTSRQRFTFETVGRYMGYAQQIGLPDSVPPDQVPDINVSPYPRIGGGALGKRTSLNWDIQNMVTHIRGNHTLKIGVNARDLYGGNRQGGALSGFYQFNGLTTDPQSPAGTGFALAQFLTGDVSRAGIDRILGNSWHGFNWSAFVQDDWRVTSRLTVNLGLRWDFQQKPYERNNGQINFDPNCTEPTSGLQGCTVYAGVDGQPRTFMEEDYNDFGPRLGFAYDLTGRGKTVFRGGYGIYYPSIFFRRFTGDINLFSRTRTNYVTRTPGEKAFQFSEGFPGPFQESPGSSAGPAGRLGQSVTLREPDATTPMTQQWNASLQHQMGDWFVDVAYAGNKGSHFSANGYNLNQVHPDLRSQLGQRLFDRVPNPNRGLVPGGLGGARITYEQSLRAFPHFTSVGVLNPRLGNYMSHQLQINLKRPLSDGLMLHFAFTGGKKISDSTQVPVDFGLVEQTNENSFQNGLYNRQAERSTDPTDVAKRAVVSLLYQLPFGRSGGGALNKLIGGWQINSIGTMQDGLPLIIRGAANNQANRPNSTGQSAKLNNPTAERWFDTSAFVNPPDFTFGNVGRVLPDVRAPGILNFDLSLIKDTYIGERVNVQFRAEAFNFMNKVNLGARNGVNTRFVAGADGMNRSATFGTIVNARDARVFQVALKVIF